MSQSINERGNICNLISKSVNFLIPLPPVANQNQAYCHISTRTRKLLGLTLTVALSVSGFPAIVAAGNSAALVQLSISDPTTSSTEQIDLSPRLHLSDANSSDANAKKEDRQSMDQIEARLEPKPWDPDPTNGPVVLLSDFAKPDKIEQTESIQTALKAASGGRLVIPSGRWFIRGDMFGTLIPEPNTTIELQEGAVLQQEPSALYKAVAVITLQHPNTHVRGRGTIRGDLRTHLGEIGENVLMIWVREGAKDWTIIGPTLTESWGDGIMVTGAPNTQPVEGGLIDHVISDNNRRQGISVIFSENLVIGDNVVLSNTGQLARKLGLPRQRPTAGLDVEPEVWGWVKGMQVGKVVADNNIGAGFLVQAPWKLDTAEVTFRGSIATRNGLAPERSPQAGFEIKEGAQVKLYDIRSDNNFGAGFGVYGAVDGRTFQPKVEVHGGTANNNGTNGWEVANDPSGGGNILNDIEGSGNGDQLIFEKKSQTPNIINLRQ